MVDLSLVNLVIEGLALGAVAACVAGLLQLFVHRLLSSQPTRFDIRMDGAAQPPLKKAA